MSKALVGFIVIVLVLAAVPFALIARSRARTSPERPVHLILDMVKQPKFKSQRGTEFFADGRTMRPLLPGVVASEDLTLPNESLVEPDGLKMVNGAAGSIPLTNPTQYAAVLLGRQRPEEMSDADFNTLPPPADKVNAPDQKFYVTTVPVPVTRDFIRRGQERFNIYCTPCHGYSGYGDGMVAQRAAEFQAAGSEAATTWVPPTNYHTLDMRKRPDGSLFNTITNGARTMPRYDKQISVLDRWAIVAYVRALQVSQELVPANVPAGK